MTHILWRPPFQLVRSLPLVCYIINVFIKGGVCACIYAYACDFEDNAMLPFCALIHILVLGLPFAFMKVIFHSGSQVYYREEGLFSIRNYVLQIHVCVDFLILSNMPFKLTPCFFFPKKLLPLVIKFYK